jgi:hypothetical protein
MKYFAGLDVSLDETAEISGGCNFRLVLPWVEPCWLSPATGEQRRGGRFVGPPAQAAAVRKLRVRAKL